MKDVTHILLISGASVPDIHMKEWLELTFRMIIVRVFSLIFIDRAVD